MEVGGGRERKRRKRRKKDSPMRAALPKAVYITAPAVPQKQTLKS